MLYENPYAGAAGHWIRCNFHTHSMEYSVCGSVPMEESIRQYAAIPSQVLALTDHNHISLMTDIQPRFPTLLLLPGFEHSQERDMLFVGTRDAVLTTLPLAEALRQAVGAVTIVCHPDLAPGTEYWSLARIHALPVLPDCLEVYNGHYSTPRMRGNGGNPRYAHVWDALLTEGCRIWGVGNDDFHDPEDFSNAFTMLMVRECNEKAVIDAMKHGHSFASTGLLMRQFRLEANRIGIETIQPCDGEFIGPGGAVLAASSGCHFHYSLKGESYVRFEGLGDAGLLFTQPVFRLPE